MLATSIFVNEMSSFSDFFASHSLIESDMLYSRSLTTFSSFVETTGFVFSYSYISHF